MPTKPIKKKVIRNEISPQQFIADIPPLEKKMFLDGHQMKPLEFLASDQK